MANQNPSVTNPKIKAMQIASLVLEATGDDVDLLETVINILQAASGVPAMVNLPMQAPVPKLGTDSQRPRSKSRGRKGGSTKSKSPEPLPKKNSKEVTQKDQTPKMVSKKIDSSGVKKSTWDNRLTSSRQRALEAYEAFKLKTHERQAAILVNACLTMSETWQRYREAGFPYANKADPLRGLPDTKVVSGIKEYLLANGWKQDIQNGHLVIQTDEGVSLRGSDFLKGMPSDFLSGN